MINKAKMLGYVVVCVSLHSFALGVLLMVLDKDLFAVFGWEPLCNRFFLHQVGIFHIVLAVIYLIEYFRYKRVTSILLAKSAAVAFLAVEYIWLTPQTPILLAGLGDGALALIVVLVYYQFRKSL